MYETKLILILFIRQAYENSNFQQGLHKVSSLACNSLLKTLIDIFPSAKYQLLPMEYSHKDGVSIIQKVKCMHRSCQNPFRLWFHSNSYCKPSDDFTEDKESLANENDVEKLPDLPSPNVL